MDGNNIFAIAIRKLNEEQLHLGVYCKSDKDESVIHLLNNYDVQKSRTIANYSYLQFIQLDDEFDIIHMISIAEAIYDTRPCEVPYGPCGGGSFDKDGRYIGEVGDGLTCSSFVMEIIESQGYELIDKSTWPLRPEDMRWQQLFIEDLGHKVVMDEDTEHLQIQEDRCSEGAFRFRPEEVGASVTMDNAPNDFESIQPISRELLERI